LKSEVKQELSQAPIIMTKPDRFFASPVDDFLTFTPSAKGVTFKYQSVQPIKAVGGGKVVFAGDLASYGQVVLIDHGNDLRTVLLGKMNIKVKKNDSVQNGDILAYTQNDSKEPQNLYFEVRKKNTAQNTILWLDPNGVSKI
jgi:septal ring factor EnvC (AmiA/AmiB activator)